MCIWFKVLNTIVHSIVEYTEYGIGALVHRIVHAPHTENCTAVGLQNVALELYTYGFYWVLLYCTVP